MAKAQTKRTAGARPAPVKAKDEYDKVAAEYEKAYERVNSYRGPLDKQFRANQAKLSRLQAMLVRRWVALIDAVAANPAWSLTDKRELVYRGK